MNTAVLLGRTPRTQIGKALDEERSRLIEPRWGLHSRTSLLPSPKMQMSAMQRFRTSKPTERSITPSIVTFHSLVGTGLYVHPSSLKHDSSDRSVRRFLMSSGRRAYRYSRRDSVIECMNRTGRCVLGVLLVRASRIPSSRQPKRRGS